MADSAPIVDYVKKAAYPETARPKVRKSPSTSSKPARMARPVSVPTVAGTKKPPDPMQVARAVKLAGTIAGMAR
jgi:hypothetical protein